MFCESAENMPVKYLFRPCWIAADFPAPPILPRRQRKSNVAYCYIIGFLLPRSRRPRLMAYVKMIEMRTQWPGSWAGLELIGNPWEHPLLN